MNRIVSIVSPFRRLGSVPLCSMGTVAVLAVSVAAVESGKSAMADDAITIRSIAPVKSFAFGSVDDVRGTVERFKKTPLYELWTSETVQSAVAEEMKKFNEDVTKRLEELGLPEDTLSWPVNIGAAVSLENNEELDEQMPVFTALADWGDGADKMAAFFEANINELAKKSPERVTTSDIRGRKVTVIDMPDAAPSEPDPFSPPDPMEGLGSVEKFYYVREGTRFLLTSSEKTMEDALTAIDVPPTALVTDEEDARAALAQLGGGDGIVILRTAPLQPLVEQGGGGMMALAAPIMTQLFGDIQAYGFSTTVDGTVGMLDSAITISSPSGRKGLLSLFVEAPPGPAPSIVPSDAIGYGRLNVAFKELMKVVESTVAALPEMYAQQVEPTLRDHGATLTKAFAALGPEVHTFTSVTQPITPESRSSTTAITCTDELAVLPLVQLVAPAMGMESRDFLGQTIFSGSPMMPVAVGIGGGYLVIGTTSNVEQALRATGQGAASAERPVAETTAMALLPSKPVVGWGWYDTVSEFDFTRRVLLAEDSNGNSGMNDFVDEQGEAVNDLVGVELPTKVIETLQKMDPEFVSRYVGPQLWQLSSDEKGMAYRFSLLRPKPAEAKSNTP